METTKFKSRSNIADTFIREVRVNYFSTAENKFKISGPGDVVGFLRTVFPDNSREHFIAIYLDGSHHVASYSIVSTGTATSAMVHPREIFQRAILAGAISLIVAHNHPSCNTTPSEEDRSSTARIKEASELLNIRLLDSLIITTESAYSILNEHPV